MQELLISLTERNAIFKLIPFGFLNAQGNHNTLIPSKPTTFFYTQLFMHNHTKHIFSLAPSAKRTECFPGVSSRQITNTHTSHPSSKPQCWQAYLLDRTKHVSLSLSPHTHIQYICPSVASCLLLIFIIYFLPHLIIDSASGSSLWCICSSVHKTCTSIFFYFFLHACTHTHIKRHVLINVRRSCEAVTFPVGLMCVRVFVRLQPDCYNSK